MREWLRHNWIMLAFLGACILSFVIADQDSSARDRAQANQLVEGCKRTSRRAAFNAAANFDVGAARRARGEPTEAAKADALGVGLLGTIPAPASHLGDPALAKVAYVKRGDTLVAVLSEDALRLQAAGCVEAYR